MKDKFLDQVAFAAHRFVEGQLSYDDLVKAVKDYADDCCVPLNPVVPVKPAVPVKSPVEVELEGVLEEHLAMLRKALAKRNNDKRVAELCAKLRIIYRRKNRARRRRSQEKSPQAIPSSPQAKPRKKQSSSLGSLR
ncbi:MAG: hypothetical protein LUI15_06825 [Firmicutes bacterium]|nr:hypothetical protein [Bacillota bacterium]